MLLLSASCKSGLEDIALSKYEVTASLWGEVSLWKQNARSDKPLCPSVAVKHPPLVTLSVATRQRSSRQRRPPLDNDRAASLAPAS